MTAAVRIELTDTMSHKEARTRLNVSRATLDRWRATGRITSLPGPKGREVRFVTADVEALRRELTTVAR